jgi:hypothetical protein
VRHWQDMAASDIDPSEKGDIFHTVSARLPSDTVHRSRIPVQSGSARIRAPQENSQHARLSATAPREPSFAPCK